MHRDDQKKSLQRTTNNKQVEYRNRPAHSQPRGRSMQAKKVKAKARHRKRNLIIFYISIFLVIIAAAITLSLTVLFKISSIVVTGTSRYSLEDIIKESGISEGSNLFLINKDSAVKNLKEKLPYIGNVTISRKLPGTVEITVADAKIAGTIPYQGGYLVIDITGKAVEQLTDLPEYYPQIIGLNISDAQIGGEVTYTDNEQKIMFTELLKALDESEFDKITKIDVSDTYSLYAEYDNRITMNFGIATDLTYKAKFAKSIFDSGKIQTNEKGTLNLSVVTDNNKVYFAPDYSITSSAASS